MSTEERKYWISVQDTVVAHLVVPQDCRVSVIHMPRQTGKSYTLMKFISEKEKQLAESGNGAKFRMLVLTTGQRSAESLKQFLHEQLGELKQVETVVDRGFTSGAISRLGRFDCLWLDEWCYGSGRRQVKLVAQDAQQIVCIGTPPEHMSDRDEELMEKLESSTSFKKEDTVVRKIDCTSRDKGVVVQNIFGSA